MIMSADGELVPAPAADALAIGGVEGGQGCGANGVGDEEDALVMAAATPKKGGVIKRLTAEKVALEKELDGAPSLFDVPGVFRRFSEAARDDAALALAAVRRNYWPGTT